MKDVVLQSGQGTKTELSIRENREHQQHKAHSISHFFLYHISPRSRNLSRVPSFLERDCNGASRSFSWHLSRLPNSLTLGPSSSSPLSISNKRLSSKAPSLSAMAPSNSPSLLSIPREIRDLIYKELLYIPIITPPSPSDPGLRFHEPFKGDYYFKLSSERFPTHFHLNLLLCNHQLHTEFLEFLDTTHSVWEYAKLDCMTEGLDMWPTWTICPADRSPKIRNLDIDLRVWNMGPLYARLLPPSISWYAFSRLLHRLLKYGPMLRFTGHGANMISVECLFEGFILIGWPRWHSED